MMMVMMMQVCPEGLLHQLQKTKKNTIKLADWRKNRKGWIKLLQKIR
jgi:hypothetical protein